MNFQLYFDFLQSFSESLPKTKSEGSICILSSLYTFWCYFSNYIDSTFFREIRKVLFFYISYTLRLSAILKIYLFLRALIRLKAPTIVKMLFQGDAPEGSDTFQWPVIERDNVDGLGLIIWDKVKVPLCHYRVMHRKRVTSELHDSYFRLMTIKHSISKIEWASNDYISLNHNVELKESPPPGDK